MEYVSCFGIIRVCEIRRNSNLFDTVLFHNGMRSVLLSNMHVQSSCTSLHTCYSHVRVYLEWMILGCTWQSSQVRSYPTYFFSSQPIFNVPPLRSRDLFFQAHQGQVTFCQVTITMTFHTWYNVQVTCTITIDHCVSTYAFRRYSFNQNVYDKHFCFNFMFQ